MKGVALALAVAALSSRTQGPNWSALQGWHGVSRALSRRPGSRPLPVGAIVLGLLRGRM